jgi:hypothetical protein
MPENFSHLNEDEQLKAENDFLKMKLMLEHGAQFDELGNNEIPAEIENEFLNNVIAFEKQFEQRKIIKVYDKIERPRHFKPVNEIPGDEINNAWRELIAHLNKFNINLDVCSPNISVRELYRFATEELFEHEMDDMDLPGWTTHFTYDEFHPDPVYDNSRMVEKDLFGDIFRKEALFYEVNYDKKEILFNNKLYESRESFIKMINRFKSLFDKIRLIKCIVTKCEVKEKNCVVEGRYRASAITGPDKLNYRGGFTVELILNDMDYWYFKKIHIDGFKPL